MKKFVVRAGLLIFVVSGMTGCYESPDATLYEPGEYKGKSDPLLEKQRSDQHQETLSARFDEGQKDR